jgi:hypothetical protein
MTERERGAPARKKQREREREDREGGDGAQRQRAQSSIVRHGCIAALSAGAPGRTCALFSSTIAFSRAPTACCSCLSAAW